MVTVPVPSHMSHYKEARLKSGFSSMISIDPCIYDEIKWLWGNGIITYGSCCGHNVTQSMVNVDQTNIQQMLDLGYVQNHTDPDRKDTFRLKSV